MGPHLALRCTATEDATSGLEESGSLQQAVSNEPDSLHFTSDKTLWFLAAAGFFGLYFRFFQVYYKKSDRRYRLWESNKFSNYWTATETYEALKIYMDMDFDGLRTAV